MQGSAYPEHDGHAHGDGLMDRLHDTGELDGGEAYRMAMQVIEHNREAPEEVEPPAESIFDHARSALRKLRGHAGDDFAHGLLVNLPEVERVDEDAVA